MGVKQSMECQGPSICPVHLTDLVYLTGVGWPTLYCSKVRRTVSKHIALTLPFSVMCLEPHGCLVCAQGINERMCVSQKPTPSRGCSLDLPLNLQAPIWKEWSALVAAVQASYPAPSCFCGPRRVSSSELPLTQWLPLREAQRMACSGLTQLAQGTASPTAI